MPSFPRAAIDATVEAAEKKLFKHSTEGFTCLRRALALALSLRDEARVVSVRDAMIAYEGEVAEDGLAGTWAVAFDEFVENRPRHVPITSELIAKLLADLEARLERLAHPGGPDRLPDGFTVEAAALRLARHYRRTGDEANVRRVVLIYGEAFKAAADHASPMLAMAWLERVLDTYRTFGLRDETETIEIRLRELGPDVMNEMKPVSTSTQIPAEEVERFLDAITTGTLEEVLVRIAVHFVPDKAALTEEVHRIAKVAPLSSLFIQKLTDRESRTLAQIGSVETDLDGHVGRRASQHMQLEIPWLRAAIDRMRERLKPTEVDLLGYLRRSPIFDDAKGPLFKRGLVAYLAEDAIVAAPVLIPQIEDALRKLVRLSGRSTYKSHRLGGLMLKSFDDLLREEPVVQSLGESVVHYFRVLFTDQRGWNVRNDVCHGIMPIQAFARPIIDRIFHALLVLAMLREQTEDEDPGGPTEHDP